VSVEFNSKEDKMSKSTRLDKADLKNIADQVHRSLDYIHDLQLLLRAKTIADLESAFRSSRTDMGEGRSIEEMNQSLVDSGLPKKFDSYLLYLFDYCFFNISYELTDGLSNKVTLKTLDKSFFSGYEVKCKKMHLAINGIIAKYEISNAIELLKDVEKGGAYESVIAAKKDPGALVSKYSNYWVDAMSRTLAMMDSSEGVKQRFEIFG